MSIGRIFRHLVCDFWSVRRAFPPAAMAAIEQEIGAQERRHDGEVRFAVEASLPLIDLLRGVSGRARAVELGSDWPVAQYDPRLGMAWARGRHTPGESSAHVFEPSQRLSGEEALLAYTLWPALARGHRDRGVLREGAVADLTVWASDPVEASPDELPGVAIVMTVVDGRIVHEQ